MFIPYSTDAPLYHRPFATLGLIIVNVLVFAWSMSEGLESDAVAAVVLTRGEGIYPWQWVTSNFIHGGVEHLVGNLVFIYVFGMIIEGKIGPWRFLACALGIGVAESAIEQFACLLLPAGTYSYGASVIVFGLIGMALVWAPANEITFGYWILVRIGTFDVSVKAAAIFYFVFNVVFAIPEITAGWIGTSVMHLLGGLLGFGLGVHMLRRGWVDCEGWDLFSRRGSRGRRAGERRRRDDEEPTDDGEWEDVPADIDFDANRAIALKLMNSSLARGDVDAAWAVHTDNAAADDSWELSKRTLMQFLRVLQGAKRWQDLRPLLKESLERFPQGATARRLLLARIYLDVEERSTRGTEVLDTIEYDDLKELELVHYKRLRRKAEELEALGVPDLGLDD